MDWWWRGFVSPCFRCPLAQAQRLPLPACQSQVSLFFFFFSQCFACWVFFFQSLSLSFISFFFGGILRYMLASAFLFYFFGVCLAWVCFGVLFGFKFAIDKFCCQTNFFELVKFILNSRSIIFFFYLFIAFKKINSIVEGGKMHTHTLAIGLHL